MKKRAAEILLAIIIMARATGYLFSTICLQEMGVFSLLAERFLLAGCLLMLLLRKKLQWNRCTIGRGCLLGLAYFLCMACELTSLKTTPTSTVSLLENNAMILVPLLEWIIYKKKPNKHTILCALVALAGVYFLTAIGVKFQLTVGELLSIGAALFSATAILLTAHFAVDRRSITGCIRSNLTWLLRITDLYAFRVPMSSPITGFFWISTVFIGNMHRFCIYAATSGTTKTRCRQRKYIFCN